MKRFLVLLALFLSLSPLCKKATDGFAITKVASIQLSLDTPPFDQTLLDQPYHYFGKGGQSYVFLSEDGKNILKLFRASKQSTLEIFQTFFPVFEEKIKKEKQALEETLKSYWLAHHLLKNETGLLATHLGEKNPINRPLKIIDKQGIEHRIDPNDTPFIIQKKATLVKDQITKWMENNEIEKAKKGINALMHLLSRQRELGIEDMDPNLAKNFGFIDDSPIEIDAGRFQHSLSFSLERLSASKEDLQHWINAHYAELSSYFDATFQDWRRRYEDL